MREYYARFFREVRAQMFIFWKAQIGVGAVAGTISAIVNAIRQQSDLGVALWSIGIAVLGYIVILLGSTLFAAVRAPIKLEEEANAAHADQLKTADNAHSLALQEKDSKIESANIEFQKQKLKTAELEAASRDWAHDYHYQQADKALKKLSDNAKAVVRHIYAHEKIDTGLTGRISIAGMSSDATMNILRSDLGSVPFIHASQELYVPTGTKFYWEIVPGYKKALGDLLFHPSPLA
jgi:hypothetical protein